MTRKINYGILKEIKELELDYMEHDYISIKGRKRGYGTSRNLKVVVKLHMMFFDMLKILKRIFTSLRLVYFRFNSLMLIHDQINLTEHHS